MVLLKPLCSMPIVSDVIYRLVIHIKRTSFMHNKTLLKGLAPVLVLFSAQAAALPFQSIDPRSLSMGGTGTASGTSANAGFMNPALLATAREDEDFSLELPIVGGRFYDPGSLVDEINNYQDNNLETNFSNALDAFKDDPTNATMQSNLRGASLNMVNQLNKFSDSPMQGEIVAGFVVGIPSKKLGASLVADIRAVGGGVLNNVTQDTQAFQGVVDALDGNITDATNAAYNVVVSDTGRTLQTSLSARGAVISEFGVSLAREFNIAGSDVAIGITPKYLGVTTFDYVVDVNTANFDASQGKLEYSDVNLDVGLAKDYGNGWKVGLALKNLIGQEYLTALGNTLKIEPQARLGVAHSTDWTTVSMDVDLNESESFGFDSKTQYIGLGAELDVFDTVQLRLGYRHNMSDSNTSMPTVGLGFSPFGVHIDIAAAANDDEIAGALQLGFRF
jgi:hypothetical protein